MAGARPSGWGDPPAPPRREGVGAVVRLYRLTLRHARLGRVALEAGDAPAARRHLLAAQDALVGLLASLNPGAGAIAEDLSRLYRYLHRRLVVANVRAGAAAAREVEGLLRPLLRAWEDVERIERSH